MDKLNKTLADQDRAIPTDRTRIMTRSLKKKLNETTNLHTKVDNVPDKKLYRDSRMLEINVVTKLVRVKIVFRRKAADH